MVMTGVAALGGSKGSFTLLCLTESQAHVVEAVSGTGGSKYCTIR